MAMKICIIFLNLFGLGKSVMEFHKNQLKSMTEHGERLESQINRLIDNISPYFIRIKS